MIPLLQDGDLILTTGNIGEIKRGEVIVFYHPQRPQYSYVMRVIALPGETISTNAQGEILINKDTLEETYLMPTKVESPEAIPEQILQADEYWVMGDNRNTSSDSTTWGPVSKNLIYGKVIWRYWPVDRIGPIR